MKTKFSLPLLAANIASMVFTLSLSVNRAASERGPTVESQNEWSQEQRATTDRPKLVHGPDVIVGDLPDLRQFGSAGTQVGLGIATTSCNNGDQPIDWFALPNKHHPVIPQNLYRMSGGSDNAERFEQIGQSWMKHAFGALEDDACALGCNTNNCSQGVQLCSGCSDPYTAGTNASQNSIGSRAWINPFTGAFPSESNDHTGHAHDGVAHRLLVEVADLNQNLNQGATYFAEAGYITSHEHDWCLIHPDECNMFNNVSYRQFSVNGISSFVFAALGPTVQMQPAIRAWTGATVTQVEPDPGNDGIFFVAYKVTHPSFNSWHYEYVVYNQNLDRAIQAFQVTWPFAAPLLSNVGFHAPPQHPGWPHDGTVGDSGYSNTPWNFDQMNHAIWYSETFAQNPNANAIRWGTSYNFRFDADAPPSRSIGNAVFFKTGSTISFEIQAPGVKNPTPTPTATLTPTPTTSPPPPTPTATSTLTPRPPRPTPTPRPRPTQIHPPPTPQPPR